MTTPLDLNDVMIAVQAIDAATQRGAFKGPEMEIIGASRNRLEASCKKAAEEAVEKEKEETPKSAQVKKIVKESEEEPQTTTAQEG
jgi:hypothetical protein